MTKNKDAALMPVEHIAQSIGILRGQRVLLDANLAALYGVPTGALVQAVKRNLERFPDDLRLAAARPNAHANSPAPCRLAMDLSHPDLQ